MEDPETYVVDGKPRRRIPLTQGQYALVDADNYDRLMQFNYYAWWSPQKQGFYAIRSVSIGNGKSTPVKMPYDVISVEPNQIIDHIKSLETLNNCRDNLRPATQSENSRNKKMKNLPKSGFKGVKLAKDGTISARIGHQGAVIHLGCFPTTEEAYKAYCDAAMKLHGEFAQF